MSDEFNTEAEAVAFHARKPVHLYIEAMPFAFIPEGYSQAVSLEHLLPAPNRKSGNIVLGDAQSFINYVAKHGNPDGTVIYAMADFVGQQFSLLAVINDHGGEPDKAAWRDHLATYTPKKSVEWVTWNTLNNTKRTQLEFATFIEENRGDVIDAEGLPSGGDMLQMAMNFEANSDKRFSQKLNLTNGGTQLEYIDDENKDTRTKMTFFDRFAIGIKVFRHGNTGYRVDSRLRYRQKESALTFWYELIRPDRQFEAAVNDELQKVVDGLPSYLVVNGNPFATK